MVLYCCAYGCQNKFVKGGPYTFHCFPRDEELRRIWEINLRRKNFKATDATKICSEHFTEDCFDKSKFGGTWLKSSAVPTIFNFSNHYEKTKKKLKSTAKDQNSRIHINNSEENSSDSTPENKDCTRKELKFNKIHSKISFIQRPNHYWGVAATNKFIIFSKWNDEYIPEKRVVIEHNLNVKVFIGDLEVNTFNLMELNSHYDVSDLLEKVDAINYSEQTLEANQSSRIHVNDPEENSSNSTSENNDSIRQFLQLEKN